MLQVQNLHKSYGAAVVLAGAGFIVNDKEHIGLIGPNGSGKSTVLRGIAGEERPDAGSIVHSRRGATIGYLHQALEAVADLTIGQAVAGAQAEWVAAGQALQDAMEGLTSALDVDRAMTAYTGALARFEALGGYDREHRAAAILQGLGLGDIAQDSPAAA